MSDISPEKAAEMYDNCENYMSENGWTFEVRRWGVKFSLTENRGKARKRVDVYMVDIVDLSRLSHRSYDITSTYKFLAKLLSIKTIEDANKAHKEYLDSLVKMSIAKLDNFSVEQVSGQTLINYNRPMITIRVDDQFVLECSTIDFTITYLHGMTEMRSIPAIGLSKVKQASKLYDALEKLSKEERQLLTSSSLRELISKAGVTPHSFCPD